MPVVTTYMRAFNSKKLDPYPVEVLKRVDRPTTKILDDQVKRVDERESGFGAPVLRSSLATEDGSATMAKSPAPTRPS